MGSNKKRKCNLKPFCLEFKNSCEETIARLNEGEKSMAVGYAAQQMAVYSEQQTTIELNQSISRESQSEDIIINPSAQGEELRILTHAFIIQEWSLFLDEIFAEILSFYIKQGKSSQLTFNMKIDISQIDFTTVARARDSIVEQFKESFSFNPYDEKIKSVKKLLSLKSVDNELKFIKKNVIIRNIFQHHRGKVRQKDVEDAGGDLVVLDNSNCEEKYEVGDKLQISKNQIKKLFENMVKVTKKVEVYR